MTAQKPTGVFVLLPLSDEQRELMVDAASFGQPDDSHDKALIAIGTPVTDGELEVVGMRARDMRSIATSAWHYSGDVENDASTYETQFLVRQSDALAKIAEKDAEIARLRSALEEIEMGIDALPDELECGGRMTAHEMRRQALEVVKAEVKALKGPEA